MGKGFCIKYVDLNRSQLSVYFFCFAIQKGMYDLHLGNISECLVISCLEYTLFCHIGLISMYTIGSKYI